jgi:lysyl-tRNA synthetase class 2
MGEFESRREKLDTLRAAGIQPYADRFDVTHALAEALDLPDGSPVRVAGRLITIRSFGRLIFAHLLDRSRAGQISFDKRQLGAEAFDAAAKGLDIGDFVGIDGVLWTTQKGERTVGVTQATLLSKALRPLPEKWHGLRDPEIRARQRYLDLIANANVRERFVLRSRVIQFIRRYLDAHGFLEVETPMLQASASGAAARPFVTHHHALDRDLFLRISPETYLKRLIVGGLERVYELGRNFRNEGIDASHLQEFTMLEWYAAYWNFRDNMIFVRDLIQAIVREFCGGTTIEFRGARLDFGGAWREVSFVDAVREATGIDLGQVESYEELLARARERFPQVTARDHASLPALMDGFYKLAVRPHLIQPTFLTHHPTELVPLARRNDRDPRILDMFQVVVNSWEIVKAYSELIDPQEQRARMVEQQAYREQGDEETMMMETDYIECMEYGMPPNSGLGLGIDRLIALLTGAENLREVIFFPGLRDAT